MTTDCASLDAPHGQNKRSSSGRNTFRYWCDLFLHRCEFCSVLAASLPQRCELDRCGTMTAAIFRHGCELRPHSFGTGTSSFGKGTSAIAQPACVFRCRYDFGAPSGPRWTLSVAVRVFGGCSLNKHVRSCPVIHSEQAVFGHGTTFGTDAASGSFERS